MRKYLLLLFITTTSILALNAQTTYFFANPPVYDAVTKGYIQPGIGEYFKATGGGTISFGTQNCDGYSISAPTSSSIVIFQATTDLNSISIRGNGTGSNRTLTSVSTATTLGGTYNTISQTNTGVINGSTCGAIVVTPGTVISAGTFIQFTFTGNLNVTDIVYTPSLPPGPPTVTTAAITGITSVAATGGGNVTSDGGSSVTVRGVCWNTSTGPTISNTRTVDGTGTGAFVSSITGLTPNTTYYVRAYATNSFGTVYGSEVTFTTTAPTPTLNVTPGSIAFGSQQINTTSNPQTYSVSGVFLSPAAGNITLTAPAGYVLSLTTNGGYASSLVVPYTGSTLAATTIYVRFNPTATAVYNGNITNSGGGAPTQNVVLTGVGAAPLGDFTNKGIDFWTGYAYHEAMLSSGSTPSNSGGNQAMVLYFTAETAATVTVSIPLTTDPVTGQPWKRIYNVPAGGVIISDTMPKYYNNNYPTSSILWHEGLFNRGIHIVSDVPIVAYAHIYYNNASGATMLLPTQTLGSQYDAVSYKQIGKEVNDASFFFVCATDTGTTTVQITPSATTQGGWLAGNTYTVTLTQGQIYNVMGIVDNNVDTGVDLSGSHVRSISNGSGVCKKIAVFSGSGRLALEPCGTGNNNFLSGDNLFQQVFPRVAWGTKYLTTNAVGTRPDNYFKVLVQDPTTVVQRNGVTLTGLIAGSYYQYGSTTSDVITADKPVSVVQFFPSTGGCIDPNGVYYNGDPEMIILSTVQQAINKTTFYSTPNENISFHRVNVIIKNGGTSTSSFRLDGATVTGFLPHPQDPNYSYASFLVNQGPHTILSDSGFNAIVYGFANDGNSSSGARESYGYNAGSYFRDLSQVLILSNPYAQSTHSLTCKNMPFFFKIAIPYSPAQLLSLTWDFSNNANLTPNAQVVQNTPTQDSTFTQDGKLYYVYKIPTAYQFSAAGTYPLKVFANTLTTDGCSGTKEFDYQITVTNGVSPRFNFVPAGCSSTQVTFTDASLSDSTNLTQWFWNFGDLTSSTVQNPPPHLYPAVGVYNASLRAVNAIGCYADTIRTIDLNGVVNARFGFAPKDSICAGSSITFSDSSNSGGINGVIVSWRWNFGDGNTITATTNASQVHTYTTGGTFTATLQVTTATGCLSNIYSHVITVGAIPLANFNAPLESCLVDSVALVDASTIGLGTITGYSWTFGDGGTSTLKNPKHLYLTAGTYTVTLVVTSANGCISAPFTKSVTINSQPTVAFVTSSPGCARYAVTFTDQSTPNSGSITQWIWNFGDGGTATLTTGTPFTHIYAVGGTYTATLKVTTSKGCSSLLATQTVLVRATPVANFTLPGSLCLPNASATFTNTTTISDGNIGGVTYIWDFGDGSGTVTATTPTHVYTGVGPYTVHLTATSANGCSHDTTKVFATINPQPVALFIPVPPNCAGSNITFTSTSTIPSGTISQWIWNFGDGTATVTASNGNPQVHAFTTAGTYSVTLKVVSASGCNSTVFSQNVVINAVPTVSFTYVPLNGCAKDSVQFIPTVGGAALGTYQWTFGDGTTSTISNPKHLYTTPSSYTVGLTVTSAAGCPATAQAQTVTLAATLASPNVVADSITPTTIHFTWSAVPGALSYLVSTDGGVTFVTPTSGSSGLSHLVTGIVPNTSVTIIVRAIGALPCQTNSGTATAKTFLPDVGIFIPNTFTPNGDGKNDILYVYGNYIKAINMKIFNQWGELIFTSVDVARGWDGTAKGHLQPVGVYIYVIQVTLTNGTVVNKSGSINLIL